MTSGDSVIGYVRVFGLSRLTRPSLKYFEQMVLDVEGTITQVSPRA